jgi:dephospho-CoA kinase
LRSAGYPRVDSITSDVPLDDDEPLWRKRFHGSADPGRPTNVHLRVDGWPGQRFALVFRDWPRAEPGVREEYLAVKRGVAAAGHATTDDYAHAKEPWFADAYPRACAWAAETDWRP